MNVEDPMGACVALLRLSVRVLEYVRFDEINSKLDCDREIRERAKACIRLLGLDPRTEYNKHMRRLRAQASQARKAKRR